MSQPSCVPADHVELDRRRPALLDFRAAPFAGLMASPRIPVAITMIIRLAPARPTNRLRRTLPSSRRRSTSQHRRSGPARAAVLHGDGVLSVADGTVERPSGQRRSVTRGCRSGGPSFVGARPRPRTCRERRRGRPSKRRTPAQSSSRAHQGSLRRSFPSFTFANWIQGETIEAAAGAV